MVAGQRRAGNGQIMSIKQGSVRHSGQSPNAPLAALF
jgi:hypothetical protein